MIQDAAQSKKDLRQTLKSQVMKLDDRDSRDQKLLNRLQTLIDHFLSEKSEMTYVGSFKALKDEVDLSSLDIQKKKKAKWCFPHIDKGAMCFFPADYHELALSHDFGVETFVPPKKEGPVVPDLILVPALGFDRETGVRLGRGGGFYDRYLQTYQNESWGVVYEVQMIHNLPTQEHDCGVDQAVTEQMTSVFQKKRRS